MGGKSYFFPNFFDPRTIKEKEESGIGWTVNRSPERNSKCVYLTTLREVKHVYTTNYRSECGLWIENSWGFFLDLLGEKNWVGKKASSFIQYIRGLRAYGKERYPNFLCGCLSSSNQSSSFAQFFHHFFTSTLLLRFKYIGAYRELNFLWSTYESVYRKEGKDLMPAIKSFFVSLSLSWN